MTVKIVIKRGNCVLFSGVLESQPEEDCTYGEAERRMIDLYNIESYINMPGEYRCHIFKDNEERGSK